MTIRPFTVPAGSLWPLRPATPSFAPHFSAMLLLCVKGGEVLVVAVCEMGGGVSVVFYVGDSDGVGAQCVGHGPCPSLLDAGLGLCGGCRRSGSGLFLVGGCSRSGGARCGARIRHPKVWRQQVNSPFQEPVSMRTSRLSVAPIDAAGGLPRWCRPLLWAVSPRVSCARWRTPWRCKAISGQYGRWRISGSREWLWSAGDPR